MGTPTQYWNGSDEYAYSVLEWIEWVSIMKIIGKREVAKETLDPFGIDIPVWVSHAHCAGMLDNERIPCRIWDVADFVMSDSEDSTVTYIEVSSPFEDLSDIGSPGVDGLPMMPEDTHAYVACTTSTRACTTFRPEHAPPPPEFVPEPVYPEFMPIEDDVLPVEEQPLPAAVSTTTDSPGYITESDPEEDPKEDDEDPEEDPTDYPTDRDEDGRRSPPETMLMMKRRTRMRRKRST
ncbi:hypothetical protein Tco_1208728 [Tanacetum coccineum]